MTDKSLHPGLGSGALREALAAIVHERDTELDMMRCEYPRGTSENKAWHDGVFAAWERFVIVKRIAADALKLSLSSPIEPVCEDCDTAAKCHGLGNCPAQASSEIREAHGICLTAKGRELLEQIIEEERKENPEGVARIEAILALAPSRQGAGGK